MFFAGLQVAVGLPLLIGAALLATSLWRLTHLELGHKTTSLVFRIALPQQGDPSKEIQWKRTFWKSLLETANALPQVEAAGISTNIPLRAEAIISNFGMGDRALLSKQPPTSDPQVRFDTATADYFRAMGIRLVRGRLSAASAEPSPIKEAIVNERFVQEFLKEEIDPIGVRLEVFGQPIEIRGIAADTYFSSPYEEPIPEVSLSALQNDLWAGQYLTLETRADRQRDSSESE